MDKTRTSQLIKYIMVLASQEQGWQRNLGPIHILKYIYLADLEHAKRCEGQTFTRARWKFYHYGPWSYEVFEEIEPTLRSIGAERSEFRSKFKDDVVRWSVEYDSSLLDRFGRDLPMQMKSAVRKYVHEFGTDTSGLLHYVYLTDPIRHAAPGDFLDFSVVLQTQRSTTHKESSNAQSTKRVLRDRAGLQAKFRSILDKKRSRPRGAPSPPPRYDEVYKKGTQWLDSMGELPKSIREGNELVISEEVWKSSIRQDPDLS
jgi:hypothetical protein